MDQRALSLAEDLVSARYVQAGVEALRTNERVVRSVIAQRRCPENGLSDGVIEQLLHQLAMMDTNNSSWHLGAGEREGRVVAPLVASRHYRFSHGIGRSGDIMSEQPKAVGSSLLYQVTNHMMLDLLRLAGARSIESAITIPMATGMTLSLVLQSIAQHQRYLRREEKRIAGITGSEGDDDVRYVIWARIDQKTALKCIEVAGLVPVPVALRHAPVTCSDGGSAKSAEKSPLHPHFLQVNVEDIAAAVERVGGPKRVVCVLSTTSCFAPRIPDDVVAISKLCKTLDIPYVVNNAYGVQSRVIMRRLDAAIRLGRVDAIVQSGDKNFLVPVGGSVLSGTKSAVHRAAALYAGRASASPVVDLFITALSLGRNGFQQLWNRRYRMREFLERELRSFAHARGEKLLGEDGSSTPVVASDGGNSPVATALPRNDISFAVTMTTVGGVTAAREIGARLFRSAVTGPRVIVPDKEETPVCGLLFQNYGMHVDGEVLCPMLVMACGIGIMEEDVKGLMVRLAEVWPAVQAPDN